MALMVVAAAPKDAGAVDCEFLSPSNPLFQLYCDAPEADLECVLKVAEPAIVIEGQPTAVTYTVTVQNNGPDAANGVVISDNPPEFHNALAGTADYNDGASDGACAGTNNLVTCNIGGLANGASASVDIVVDITADIADILKNTASVAAMSPADPDPTNNGYPDVAECEFEVVVVQLQEYDVACVEKTVDKGLVARGDLPQDLTYTVTVVNNGPGEATGVRVIDNLMPGVTYLSGTVSDFDSGPHNCQAIGTTVLCPGGLGTLTLAANESAVATIMVRIPADFPSSIVGNVGSVTAPEDTNLANNGFPGVPACFAKTLILEEQGDEGCTPGGWRNPPDSNLALWAATPYATGDDFDTIFGVNFFEPDLDLIEAIHLGGGGLNALARHGVAGILNASHPDVDYFYTVAEVIALVQTETEASKNLLVIANEAGCPDDRGD